jgi:tRNA (cmo5U34)-methyltransferase
MDIPRNWTFETSEVAKGFERHVREQLPWYELITGAVAHVARHYIPTGGRIYDIGASTGNIGRALAETIEDRKAELIGIEASASMAELYSAPGKVICADALHFDFEPFDVGILMLVMMFMPVAERGAFLERLAAKARPGGALIIIDKVEVGGAYAATALYRLALAGKVAAQVPADEIIAKELSLGGVQRPLSGPPIAGAVEFFRFGAFAGWVWEAAERQARPPGYGQ